MPALTLQHPALPGPFAIAPSPHGVVPTAATRRLVDSQVDAMLTAAPSYHQLSAPDRAELARHMKHVAAYAAELVRDDWWQSAQLGQRPVLRRRAVLRPAGSPTATARSAATAPIGRGATTQVGTVTRQTLQAIAFPDFVADLIRSTFRAITDASIQQLDAVRALLGNVSGTVDEFEESNITDSQARAWLAQQYRTHLQLQNGTLSARPDAPETPPPWDNQLGLGRSVDPTDADAVEEILVPAARRKLSQNRLETLSLLVLMGLDRIVVTGGKIRATMAFHIDASDAVQQANASQFDMRVAAAGSVGFGPWSASVSTSVGYVTSSRTNTESEINVAADLTGEVELHFRSDPVQVQRMLGDTEIGRIVANTPVPAANEAIPWGPSVDARAAVAPRRTSDPIQIAAPPPPPPLPPLPGQPGAAGATQPGANQPAATPPGGGAPGAVRPATPPGQPAQPGAPTPPPGQPGQPAGAAPPPGQPGQPATPPSGQRPTGPPPGPANQPTSPPTPTPTPVPAGPTPR
jgi:hypothetical protein